MVDTAGLTMAEIKATVLEDLTPREAVDPMAVIERLQTVTGISSYDLKAAIWYLIGDRSIRLDNHLNIVRIDPADRA